MMDRRQSHGRGRILSASASAEADLVENKKRITYIQQWEGEGDL
jgi:hypothetical protein